MIHKIDGNNYPIYTKQKSIDVPDTGEKFNLGYDKNGSPSEAKAQKDKEVAGKEKQPSAERNGVRLELSSNGRMADAGRQKQQETAKAEAAQDQMPLLETIRTFVKNIVAAVQEFFSKIWNDPPSAEGLQDITEASGVVDTAESAHISERIDASEIIDNPEIINGPESIGTLESIDALENADAPERIDASDIVDIPESFGAANNMAVPKSIAPKEIIDTSDAEISDPFMDEELRNRKIRQSLQDGDMEQVISLLTHNGKRTIAKNSTLLTSYDKHGRVVEPNASDRERALHGDKNSWKL